MTDTVTALETSLRRLGRERLQEKTVEAVIRLAPGYDSVATFLREAGISAPRRAAGIQKKGRQAFQWVIDDYDPPGPADIEELEIWLRSDMQEIVDKALEIIIMARDEVFQMEQIMAQTSLEQRLEDRAFRERRQAVGFLFDQAWYAGQWITGAWAACTSCMEHWQKDGLRGSRKDVSSPQATTSNFSEQKIVLLSAWKKALAAERSG